MSIKPKTIEERVSSLEREVAALKAAIPSPSNAGVIPGFAEDGQPALATGTSIASDLEQRVAQLEATVEQLKSAMGQPGPNDWRDAVGWAKDDPGYDEAMRLGAEWRRRENLKSIRELERRGEIDADPGHRSSQRPGSRRKRLK
jgi:uncharacterized small protein (DUF1192 family)